MPCVFPFRIFQWLRNSDVCASHISSFMIWYLSSFLASSVVIFCPHASCSGMVNVLTVSSLEKKVEALLCSDSDFCGEYSHFSWSQATSVKSVKGEWGRAVYHGSCNLMGASLGTPLTPDLPTAENVLHFLYSYSASDTQHHWYPLPPSSSELCAQCAQWVFHTLLPSLNKHLLFSAFHTLA